MNKIYSIYLFTFPNNKKYCGYTSQKPERRWGGTGNNYQKCPLVWSAIQKYGWNNIKKEVIFSTTNQQEAFDKEKEIINYYQLCNPEYGYNIDLGGRPHGAGDHLTEEGRKKLSEHSKALWADPAFREARLKELKNRKPTPQCIEAARIVARQNHLGVTPPNARPVEQLDKNTNEKIADFISASHAAKAIMGEVIGCGNILKVCKGQRQTAYGYKWRFKQE